MAVPSRIPFAPLAAAVVLVALPAQAPRLELTEVPASRPAIARRPFVAAGTPFAGDVDGRGGFPEIVVGAEGRVVVASEGRRRAFDLGGCGLGGARVVAAVVGDVDGDGAPELLTACDAAPRLRAFDAAGRARFAADVSADDASALVLDGDGADDLVLGGAVDARRYAVVDGPRVVFSHGTRLARFTTGDWDREGGVEVLAVDAEGGVRVFGADGRVSLKASLGAPAVALAFAGFDPEPGRLDVLAATADRLVALLDDGTPRFVAPLDGALSDLQSADLDGLPPTEVLGVVVRDGASSIRAWREDGGESFRAAIGARLRTFVVSSLGGDGARRAIAFHGRGSAVPAFDLRGGAFAAFDVGVDVRSVAVGDFLGDDRPELAAVDVVGAITIFDAAGGVARTLRPTGGRASAVRATDLDGDGRAETAATLDGGGACEIFGRDGASRGVVRAGARFRGVEPQFADGDGDGAREIFFVREESPAGAPRRTAVAGFARDGTRRFERTLEGGRPRTALADVDAERGAELIVCGDGPSLAALDADGFVVWRIALPAPVDVLRVVDLDRDGVSEALALHADGVLRLWAPRPRDERPRRRARFVAALSAAEAGDEATAARAFADAGVEWAALDRFAAETLAKRAKAAGTRSPAAAAAGRALATAP